MMTKIKMVSFILQSKKNEKFIDPIQVISFD